MERRTVFPNPLVNTVVFQIRFPNLFYMADHIGKFQVRVMKEFPEAKQLYRRQIVIVNGVEHEQSAQATDAEALKGEGAIPIWQFQSPQGVTLNVCSNSLSLASEKHKSYNLGDQPFRDAIESACGHFLAVTSIPILKRVGLRYVDHGPIPENRSSLFSEWYHTAFSLERFPLESASEMTSMAVVDRDEFKLRYIEALQGTGESRHVVLDFDAWAENIEPGDLLSVTDRLHEVLWREFQNTVKDPVWRYMETPKEAANVSR